MTYLSGEHFLVIISIATNPDENVFLVVQNVDIALVHHGPRNVRQVTNHGDSLALDRIQRWIEFISHVLETGSDSTRKQPNSVNR